MLESPLPMPAKPKKRTWPVQHKSLSSQRVKYSTDRPLSTQATEISMIRFLIGHQWWMLRTFGKGNQETSIHQGSTRIRSLNWPVTCSVRQLDRTMGINAREENTYLTLNVLGMVGSIQPQDSQRSWIFQGVIMLILIGLQMIPIDPP